MKTKWFYLSFLIFAFSHTYQTVQSQAIDRLITGSTADANYLVKGFLSPALSVVGYGLNQGWYNTAKPHKIAGFDLTTTVSFVQIPTSDLSFYVDNSKLNTIERLNTAGGNPASGLAPTAFGPTDAPRFAYKSSGMEFDGAPGAGLDKVPVIKNSLPVPMAQIGFGLPKGFELKFRFVPKVNFGDNNASNFSLFGIGLMHDVKRYIPGIKELPFDLSGFVGYTKLTYNVAFDSNHPDQKGVLSSSATTVQGVISKKLSVLTAYAGLGYNFATTKVDINGSYDLTGTGVTTPVAIGLSGSSNGPRATFGLRLKLAVFTLHGDYTLQKYSTLSLGFGIAVR
jgi:hypothetical protein